MVADPCDRLDRQLCQMQTGKQTYYNQCRHSKG